MNAPESSPAVRTEYRLICDDCLSLFPVTTSAEPCPICARQICPDCQPLHRHGDGPANTLGQCGGN